MNAQSWLDAGVIEIASVKCALDMAGDQLCLISKELDLPQFSAPLIFAYLTFLVFYYGMCRRIVRYKFLTFLMNTASSYRVL